MESPVLVISALESGMKKAKLEMRPAEQAGHLAQITGPIELSEPQLQAIGNLSI